VAEKLTNVLELIWTGQVLVAEDRGVWIFWLHPRTLQVIEAAICKALDVPAEALDLPTGLQFFPQLVDVSHQRVRVLHREIPGHDHVSRVSEDEETAVAGRLGDLPKAIIRNVEGTTDCLLREGL
jgi:hypothetical protein